MAAARERGGSHLVRTSIDGKALSGIGQVLFILGFWSTGPEYRRFAHQMSMFRIGVSILIIFLAAVCSAAQSAREKRSIYSLVTSYLMKPGHRFFKTREKALHILERTEVGSYVCDGDLDALTKRLCRSESWSLDPYLPTSQVRLVGLTELERFESQSAERHKAFEEKQKTGRIHSLWNCDQDMIEFYETYPAAKGIYRLSPIAFSTSRRKAMVIVSFKFNCGDEVLYFDLSRNARGKWKISKVSGGAGIA